MDISQIQNICMKRKRSASKKKKYNKNIQTKCNMCLMKYPLYISLKEAIYRKYANSQNHYYLALFNTIVDKQKKTDSTALSIRQQCMERYHKNVNRKYVFLRVKQVYKLHKQIPRIFHQDIKNILDKCYHRKRLLQYFKLAKFLGLQVESVKLSTFLLSMTHKNNNDKNEQFDRIIDKISGYDFSEEIEKQLIDTMNGKNQHLNPQNTK